MLTITVPGLDMFDESTNRFVTTDDTVLELEHSLVSLSKWEMIWEVPFLGPKPKTSEQTLSYIKCMTLTPDVPDEVFNRLTQTEFTQINEYIESKMTATWFTENGKRGPNGEIVTNEIIRYWMIALQIPDHYEREHLGRLFTLVRVVNEKNQPKKKVSAREAAERMAALNAKRLAESGLPG